MSEPSSFAEPGRDASQRYVVEATLGRGGMGTVYRVRDASTGRSVALKRAAAHDHEQTATRRALLEREYHTLAQLRHPRIIEVYDYGVDDDGAYYTMEVLDGVDLETGGRIPWREACALLFDVASCLAILHSRGLVHRDVSSRNVRRTADGHAKLLDFGAMVCMGVAKEVVGTPTFMAPEALALQALDGRADLFALGALGYYLLTGRHAFPARSLADLRDIWRSRPQQPSRIAADVPPALGALILQLLSIERSARPRSAAEVMERLSVIAGLPLQERVDVSRAYLTTPTLVGRERALVGIRTRMLSLVRGDGGALLITGAAGSGRSRMLDACVVEGKLLGALVARADATDGASGEWGVARALGTQLLQLRPREAEEAARLSRDVLGHVIESLRVGRNETLSIGLPERSLILRHLRDFVLALAKGRRLLLIVDDADQIDEPSAAFLASLAHRSERHSVMIALSCKDDAYDEGSPLHLLHSIASPVELDLLDAEQTEALVRSLFGDVNNIRLCAGRIHALAQGNPGTTMELAQHLVRSGLARYEAGNWLLPGILAAGALPLTIAASLRQRVSALAPDARELAEVLCMCEGRMGLHNYVELTDHRDQKRVFYALDELVAARVLTAEGERYRFSQRGFPAALIESLSPERNAQLHQRIAGLLALHGGDVVDQAHHLLQAGHEEPAIGLLCSIDLNARLPPIDLLDRAREYAVKHELSALIIYRLSMAVIMKASLVMAGASFRRCVPTVLERLERESGLRAYRELDQLPPDQRLGRALALTQERYAAAPENDRVFAVGDAIRELARLSAAFCSMSMTTFDLPLLESLPSVEPLCPLSPALQVVAGVVEASREWLCGRTKRSTELTEELLARLNQPDRAGLDEAQYTRTMLGEHYVLAVAEASIGSEAAEERAQILENYRDMRINAWRVRVMLRFHQGNADAARKCQLRAELLQAQDGGEARYAGVSAGFELTAMSTADDLLGVKNTIDAIQQLAAQHPGWQAALLFAQSRYRQLQGDFAPALELALEGLARAPAGQHMMFPMLACSQLSLLADLGRVDEAVACGLAHVAACERERLIPGKQAIERELAPILARAGKHREALEMIEAVVAWREGLGGAGLSLGIYYEARARVALYMSDRATFERFAERCALEYQKGQNPVLTAKFARLLEEAHQQGLEPSAPARELVGLLGPLAEETAYNTIRSRIFECTDADDRARCALTLLLQSADCCMGYLFGMQEHDIRPLSALPESSTDLGLLHWVEQRVVSELEADAVGMKTLTEGGEPLHSQEYAARYRDAEGRWFDAVLLIGESEQQARLAGVLVMQSVAGMRKTPPRYMTFEIANRLLELGDVTGVALRAATITNES